MSGATSARLSGWVADAVGALDAHADFRVLRRMVDMKRGDGQPPPRNGTVGCALDVETTGLDPATDRIIELALQRFWADAEGRIVVVGRARSWREDPGRSLSPRITMLTGLADADVRGRSIFDPEAACMIADCDFVVAHNARFDRPFVERRLPHAAGRPWTCSLNDVDWRSEGFEGRSLSHLLLQMGWFYSAHRASTDVTALLRLLDHDLGGGRTVLREALETARRPAWVFDAVGAPFAAKDQLKARGYRWNSERRLWSREVNSVERDDEMRWITSEVYGGLARPRIAEVTWRERYSV